ncbi:hypothetical protein Lser_V15G05999 [Lactuca serriola]
MKIKHWIEKHRIKLSGTVRKMMMKCFHSGERFGAKEMNASSESLATRDYSASGYSSRVNEPDPKLDNSNIEEAESSLRESGFLNYEEARALLGRLEYQKGNVEGALHVFEGIDIPAVIPKIKNSLARRSELSRRHSQGDDDPSPPMSVHAISLLFEAVFLKSKSLQALGRFREAAESCKIILETIESALPDGFLDFSSYYKLQETVDKAVELLPELWKLASDPQSAILSYRRALLFQWNLDKKTRMNLEKEFAVFLLYSGCDATPPNLRSQMESSYVPKNNVEEAILLLLILLRKIVIGIIEWDPSIYHHLSFALSISHDLKSLAHQIEEFPPGIIEKKERYSTLALCYYGEDEDMVSLNLLRSLLNNQEKSENQHNFVLEMLLASKICIDQSDSLQEGITYLHKLMKLEENCNETKSVANFFLGISLSAQSRNTNLDSERIKMQSEALNALETAHKMKQEDANILFHLSLEYAEQRKLDMAVYYAKKLVKVEGGDNVKGWILLARILSAKKQYFDAEVVIDAAIDETGKWDQGELLRTKAKLQIAQGKLKNGIETYTRLLAVLQVRSKSFGVHKRLLKKRSNKERELEMETWHDLANLYTSLLQWHDAEVCLSKSKTIDPHSASRWHAIGILHQAKGEKEEALSSFEKALDVDPNHVPSLISTAIVLRELNDRSLPIAKSFITDALRLDRTNSLAWFNLGLVYKVEHGSSALEAAECFEAAIMLQESEPIEPFR